MSSAFLFLFLFQDSVFVELRACDIFACTHVLFDAGLVTTLVGGGSCANYCDGVSAAAALSGPTALASSTSSPNGEFFILEETNNKIRIVSTSGLKNSC